MHLLEVALQGVRGFPATLRLPLHTGYTVLRPSTSEPAPLAALMAGVLHTDGRGAEAALSAQKERPGRVALTLAGNDGNVYRLVRELGGKAALQRMSGTVQTLETLAQDAPGILHVLRGPVGMPSRTVFSELFLLTGDQRPSARARQKAQPAPGAPALGLNAQPAVTAARDVLGARARLTELEVELAFSREVAQLQFEADGVESDLYQLTARLDAIEKPRQALAQAQEDLARAPTPASLGLPEDILARVERYPAAVRRREEQMARLAAEREKAASTAVPVTQRVEPLLRDRRFLAAVGGGLLLFVLGTLLSGGFRYLALLDIPVFAFAAIRALHFVEHLQRREERERRAGMLAARERKVHEEFDAEAGPVVRGMATLDVDTPEELVAALAEFTARSAEVHRLREVLVLAESDPARQADLLRQQELQNRLAQLNAQLEKKGGYVRDVREVERELARVRDSLALAEGGPVAGGATSPLQEPLQDPCPGLLGLAAEVMQADLAAAAGLVRDRLQQYFAALTDKRYGTVEFEPTGRATVQVGPTRAPATSLPPKDVDLLYLSLRLTVVEKLSMRVKVPLFVEDAFESLDEAKFGLMSRMLKHLGTLTQVIQVAVHPAFVSDRTGTL